MMKRIIVTICALLLIGCSSDYSNDSYRLGKFEIRNIELYWLNDLDCAFSYSSGMDILFHCDTTHIAEGMTVPPGSYVMADVWVTDEDLNARYLNLEVRDSGNNLDYALHNYLIEFSYSRQEVGAEYQLFLITYAQQNATGIHTLDVWLESYSGRFTDVYTVEIDVM